MTRAARYVGEPLPRPRPDGDEPSLSIGTFPDAGGLPVLDAPDDIPIDSRPHARVQRHPLTAPVIGHAGHIAIPQASGGRRIIDNRLDLPVQTPTPMPDGRRINRPEPRPWDTGQAVGGGS